jgi:GDPmannose 4,6-dehydratase
MAFECIGTHINWIGEGLDEVGVNSNTGKVLVRVDPTFFRPAEVDLLIGDATRAKEILGWEPKLSTKEIIKEMVEYDCRK